MSKSLNKAFIMGNVGMDPEIKSTGSGTMLANFSIATESRYKDTAGNWQTKTQWHRMTAWAKLAEIVRDYVHKGDKLHIEGEIEYREHEGKHYTSIKVQNLILLGGKSERKTVSDSNPAPAVGQVFDQEVSDDDIPF
jgi:single-strand DNA-binding protein